MLNVEHNLMEADVQKSHFQTEGPFEILDLLVV